MKRLSRALALKVAVIVSLLMCVVVGLYMARCWQVRSWILDGYGELAEEYDARASFLLAPAFSGEPHWHWRGRGVQEGKIECLHGWRMAFAMPESYNRYAKPEWNVIERNCRFALDSSLDGKLEWTAF